MTRLLDGIRVVEWGGWHAGPGGTALLGDLGAEVIKIEGRIDGDPERASKALGSFSLEIPGGGGRTLLFEASGRNKKSITLDITKPEGKEIAYRLVDQADVFLTNHRKSVVAKQGFEYDTLRKRNPRLVYAHVSAFGRNGPDADLGGYDFQGQARSGFMTAMGPPGIPPLLIHLGVVDQMTAFTASYAVIAALLARERHGFGQEVHASLLGSAMCLLYCNILSAQLLGKDVPRHDRSGPGNPLRNYYQCQDGKWVMLTHNPGQRYWPQFCQALGISDLIDDPRFHSDAARGQNANELVAILDQAFATKPREQWLAIARQAKLLFGPVNFVTDLADDPQVLANDYLVDLDFPGLGLVKVPGFPIQFSETPAKVRSAAPELGEHTEEVLSTLLGLSSSDLDDLRQREII